MSSWLALLLLLSSPPGATGLLCSGYGVLPYPCHRCFPPARSLDRPSTSTRSMLNPTSFEGSDMTITDYPMPVLRRRGADVVDFDDDLRRTCAEMISIMYQADGVGLAAPQVNLGVRLFVYNHLGDSDKSAAERIVINPDIVEYSRETTIEEEACLSSRSGRCGGFVCRSEAVAVTYRDEEGRQVRRRLRGFEARVFQHEYDHVEGVLHLDRFCQEDREKIQPELDDMLRAYRATAAEAGVLDVKREVRAGLRPPPLGPGRMPPLGWGADGASAGGEVRRVGLAPGAEEPVPKTGFGGFGGGGGKKKKGKRKKK